MRVVTAVQRRDEAIRQGDIPGVQLRCRVELPVPPAEGWRWVSEPALLRRWLGNELREGRREGSYEVEVEHGGERWTEALESVEEGPPRSRELTLRRLDTDWPPKTRVRLEVFPAPRGCQLSLLHHGFHFLSLSDCMTAWEAYRRRWRRALERLEGAVGGPASSA